jgi:hypothetical protein
MLRIPVRYLYVVSVRSEKSQYTAYHETFKSQLFLQNSVEKLAILASVGVVDSLI